MTEQEARQLCKDRNRNPDREMTGPHGIIFAWETYVPPISRQTAFAYYDMATSQPLLSLLMPPMDDEPLRMVNGSWTYDQPEGTVTILNNGAIRIQTDGFDQSFALWDD